MKKHILMVPCMILAAGCGSRSDYDANKDSDKIVKDSQKTIDEVMANFYSGGQPGKISIKGFVFRKEGDNLILDDRMRVEQVVGAGKPGVPQPLIAKDNQAVFSEMDHLDPASLKIESKTYVNLGCENLDPEEIKGLKLESHTALMDSVWTLFAKKIFICGDYSAKQAFFAISAEELILKDATLRLKAMVGRLSVSTSKLVLVGTNSINTIGFDAIVKVMDAPSLDLVVKKEVDGEGSLKVASYGGNCIEKDEKE